MHRLTAVAFVALTLGVAGATVSCGDQGEPGGPGGTGGGDEEGGSGGTTTTGGKGGSPATGGSPGGTGGVGGSTGTGGAMGGKGGGSGGTGGAPSAMGGASGNCSAPMYLPFKVGNKWTYRVSNTLVPSLPPETKVNLIERAEMVPDFAVPKGGMAPMAFKVVTTKGESDKTVSWQAPVGGKVVRYAERAFSAATGDPNQNEYFVPHKLRWDDALAMGPAGKTSKEMYTDYKQDVGSPLTSSMHTDTWTVKALNTSVTIKDAEGPGKNVTWSNCVETTKTGGNPADVGKTYWYCKCVGKAKEQGREGQLEELVKFEGM